VLTPRCLAFSFALVAVLAASPARPQDPVGYVNRVADRNAMGVNLTNYGFLGNNFTSRSPSMEYPLGSGYEHLVNGGLWIGAQATDVAGAFTGVTTACLDGTQGIASQSGTEFTPASRSFRLRSTLPTSPYYDPDAVSELDLIGPFDDLTAKHASNNPEVHRPLGVEVRQESYAWSFAPYADILFVRYTITNHGAPLSNVWVGLFTELMSGPKNAYSCWPPSSACSAYGSWFSKAWLEYDPPLRLLREHRCAGYPIPGGCQLAVTPYWAGVKILTPPDPARAQAVTLAAWNWSPGNTARDQDTERYAILSAGTIQSLTTPDVMPVTGDPVELLALGPFPSIDSGDSVHVDFALVGGAEITDIQEHAAAAQRLYDAAYDIDGTTPALVSVLEARALGNRRVGVTWLVSHGTSLDAVVQRCDGDLAWRDIGSARADGEGRVHFEDTDVASGRHGYRLAANGQAFEEAWVDVPDDVRLALVGPANPSFTRELELQFSVPGVGPALLRLVDVAGRTLDARTVEATVGGPQRTILRVPASASPGVYWIQLQQGEHAMATRVAVMR